MFFCLLAIGGLGWASGKHSQLAVGILLVISTLINMITIGPACYPIVAETPSGRLRYKTIVIGRFVYNLTGIFSNSVTPRMISAQCKSSRSIYVKAMSKVGPKLTRTSLIAWNWGAKTGLFYAGTNLLCNIWCWFRLPETKDRTFGEIDLLFDNHVHARKFKYTKVNRKLLFTSSTLQEEAESNVGLQNLLIRMLMRLREKFLSLSIMRRLLEDPSIFKTMRCLD